MPENGSKNEIKSLNFSGPHIEAKAIYGVENYLIKERTIVINPSTSNVILDEYPEKILPSMNSLILQDLAIKNANILILFTLKNMLNIGNIILEKNWSLYGDIAYPDKNNQEAAPYSYPYNTPLYKSSQDTVGTVEFDPFYVNGQRDHEIEKKTFTVKVNLWFSPGETDCFIHNTHDFIEIHSQLYGTGRMQKFNKQEPNTLYEDIIMSPGYTTDLPFCNVNADLSFTYPWHRYYANTDCIWAAIEFHPT